MAMTVRCNQPGLILLSLCLLVVAGIAARFYTTDPLPDSSAFISHSRQLAVPDLVASLKPVKISALSKSQAHAAKQGKAPSLARQGARSGSGSTGASSEPNLPIGNALRVKQMSDFELSNFQRFVQLDSEQQARLKEKFAKELVAGRDIVNIERLDEDQKISEVYGTESLRDILGEAAFEDYRKARDAEAARSKEQKMESNLFYLSRKLTLNSEQEAALMHSFKEADLASSDIERQINERLSAVSRLETGTMPADPQAKEAQMEEIRKLLEEKIAVRRQTIHSLAHAFLSDEQYNALLALDY